MKSVIAILLLCALSSVCYSQGLSPFWKPLTGPVPEVQPSELGDSSIVAQEGGVFYTAKDAKGPWVPKIQEGVDYKYLSYPPYRGFIWMRVKDTLYGSVKDSLFFSTDNGTVWKLIGAFGPAGSKNLTSLTLTPAGVFLVFDVANNLYVTKDNFSTIDTEKIPAYSGLLITGEIIRVAGLKGVGYESDDYGKTWKAFVNFQDTTRNRVRFVSKGSNLIVIASTAITKFPYGDSNIYLGYSSNSGATWRGMTKPVNTQTPVNTVIDNEGRIFLQYAGKIQGIFRSVDSGSSWQQVYGGGSYLELTRDNYLIMTGQAGVLVVSTNHGDAWDTLSSAGMVSIPTDAISLYGSVYLSTLDSLSRSTDNGATWSSFPGGNVGALMRGYNDRLMVNSYYYSVDSGNHFVAHEPTGTTSGGFYGIGAISTAGNLWTIEGTVIVESTDSGGAYIPVAGPAPGKNLFFLSLPNDTMLISSSRGILKGENYTDGLIDVTPRYGESASVLPTGAMTMDSSGAIYVAMTDGKVLRSSDNAKSWTQMVSPSPDSIAPIQHLTAAPHGLLFAIDSNRTTGATNVWEFDSAVGAWKNITGGLSRPGYANSAIMTGIWYANNYMYAGAWNMGLFRSIRPLSGVDEVEHGTPPEVHYGIYPNPASVSATITYDRNYQGSVLIVDVSGRTVGKWPVNPAGGSVTVDLKDLPAGAYEVIIGNQDYRKISKLLVEH